MTILHDHIEDNQNGNSSNRTVLLHQHADTHNTLFTTAHMNSAEATITRMSDSTIYSEETQRNMPLPAEIFTFSHEEADAFVTAWTTFKNDMAQAKAEALAKEEAAYTAAFDLAREMGDHLGDLGEVSIKQPKEYDEQVYTVSLPALNWLYRGGIYSSNPHVYTGAGIYEAVKAAFLQIAEYIDILDTITANQRKGWSVDVLERNDRWVALWNKQAAWREQVNAAHFTEEQNTPKEEVSAF